MLEENEFRDMGVHGWFLRHSLNFSDWQTALQEKILKLYFS